MGGSYATDHLVVRDVSAKIREAAQRLDRLHPKLKKFAVVRLWPDQAAAEHENLQRIRRAANLIGVDVVEIDSSGRLLDGSEEQIERNTVQFVLHLHYQTAKSYDATSVAALWNPVQFYVDWGFDQYWSNQMSHDLFATAGSRQLRALVEGERGSVICSNMPLLNHTLADPIYAVRRREKYSAFYVGINWERLGRSAGRHDALLRELDKRNCVSIYGPSRLNGVHVWEGFKGYKGELPFDGRSVVEQAAIAGAALVLSSEPHKDSAVMSNRLFEAMAAGAVVIGDDHPFLREALGDGFVAIPVHATVQAQADVISDALAEFAKNPEAARALAERAQTLLLEKYFLCDQLVALFEAVERLEDERRTAVAARGPNLVDIVVQALDRPPSEICLFSRLLVSELGMSGRVIVLAPSATVEMLADIRDVVTVVDTGITRFMSFSECIIAAMPYIRSVHVCVFSCVERLIGRSFLASIASLDRNVVLLRLSYVIEHTDPLGNLHSDFFIAGDKEGPDEVSTAACVVKLSWIRGHLEIPALSAEALTRVAVREGREIAISHTSCMTIDFNKYEDLRRRIPRKLEWRGVDAQLIDRKASKLRAVSSDVTLVDPRQFYPAVNRSDLRQEVVAALQSLSERDRLELARGLYRALPLPHWLKKLVWLARRKLGLWG